MRTEIPESHVDLLDRPTIAHWATVRPDGAPQANPVWFEFDGEFIKVSQTTGRQKLRNVEGERRVALSILDPDNAYRYLEVRGRVEQIEPDPENKFIDAMAQRYLDQDRYPWHQPDDERVVVYVRPTATSTMG